MAELVKIAIVMQCFLRRRYNQGVWLQGDLINDSHAEVIAKRALQVWLYGELDAALTQVPCMAHGTLHVPEKLVLDDSMITAGWQHEASMTPLHGSCQGFAGFANRSNG